MHDRRVDCPLNGAHQLKAALLHDPNVVWNSLDAGFFPLPPPNTKFVVNTNCSTCGKHTNRHVTAKRWFNDVRAGTRYAPRGCTCGGDPPPAAADERARAAHGGVLATACAPDYHACKLVARCPFDGHAFNVSYDQLVRAGNALDFHCECDEHPRSLARVLPRTTFGAPAAGAGGAPAHNVFDGGAAPLKGCFWNHAFARSAHAQFVEISTEAQVRTLRNRVAEARLWAVLRVQHLDPEIRSLRDYVVEMDRHAITRGDSARALHERPALRLRFDPPGTTSSSQRPVKVTVMINRALVNAATREPVQAAICEAMRQHGSGVLQIGRIQLHASMHPPCSASLNGSGKFSPALFDRHAPRGGGGHENMPHDVQAVAERSLELGALQRVLQLEAIFEHLREHTMAVPGEATVFGLPESVLATAHLKKGYLCRRYEANDHAAACMTVPNPVDAFILSRYAKPGRGNAWDSEGVRQILSRCYSALPDAAKRVCGPTDWRSLFLVLWPLDEVREIARLWLQNGEPSDAVRDWPDEWARPKRKRGDAAAAPDSQGDAAFV
jgi:hypothetical protein